MALHKRKQSAKPEKSDFDKKYDEMMTKINEQTNQLKDLTGRIDKLIELDKQVHDKVDPKPEDPKPDDPKPDEGDTDDKKDEHEEKIENA